MKWIFLVPFLISGSLFSQKIIWQENNRLKWENFKSKINNQQGDNVVAYTHCGWEYSVVKSTNPKIPVRIKVTTIFNEDQSWKDVRRINDYVLLHEQKHFDIAEIHARKLRKEIAERIKTSGDYNKYFQAIYNRVLNDYRKFQAAYDRETRHGMNEEKQAEYNRVVSEALETLKSYAAS